MLVYGSPGSGKTQVVSAVGQELIRSGRKVMFATCGLMVQDLSATKRELRLRDSLKIFSRFEVFMFDDIEYVR